MESTVHDVIIVGAGLSGLSSARVLQSRGLKVKVLEASPRVGGRLYTIHNPSVGSCDLGGAYVGPTQDRVFRIARELGIPTYRVYDQGDILYYRKGKRRRFSGDLPPLRSVTSFMDIATLYKAISKMADKVSTKEPWKSRDADKLDSRTLQEWYNQNVWTDGAMADAKFFSRINLTAEPYEISLLWALWYIRQGQGPLRMNAISGGAQERKFVGGSQQLPEKLAARLEEGAVVLGQPVVKVSHSDGGVEVETAHGLYYKARYVVLALAPPLQQKITFEPPLPSVRNQLLQRVPMGSIIKTVMYYDRPYWREQGLSGMSIIQDDNPELPVQGTFDDTKPDGSRPALIGFLNAQNVQRVQDLTKEERCTLIAQSYAMVFNCPALSKPVHYEEMDWGAEPWIGGCYTGIMGPGTLTRFGKALRQPIDRLHFAGTETATHWTGYMEGAIQAGERAAREILHTIGELPASEIYQDEPPTQDIDASPLSLSLIERLTPSPRTFYTSMAAVLALTGLALAKL